MSVMSHLRPKQLAHAEFAPGGHRVHELPFGVTLEDVLDPEYWAHLAAYLKVGTLIDVHDAAYRIDTTLRVVAVDPRGHWAQVVVRGSQAHSPPPAETGASDADGFVTQKDPVQGWRIMRGNDLLAKGLPDEEAVRAKLAQLKAGKTQPAQRV